MIVAVMNNVVLNNVVLQQRGCYCLGKNLCHWLILLQNAPAPPLTGGDHL